MVKGHKTKKKKLYNIPIFIMRILVIIVVVIFVISLGLIFRNNIFFKKFFFLDKEVSDKISEENNIIINKINETDRYEYNGVAFIKEGRFWTSTVKIHNYEYYLELYYGPREVEDINIIYNLNNFTFLTSRHKEAYIVFDPRDSNLTNIALASATLSRSLTDVYGITPIAACTEKTQYCENRPIIVSCASRPDRAIIFIRSSNITRVEYSGNCLFVEGKNEELLRATEKTRLGWYGIVH
ncbi:MAG: hypothetical protein QXG00_08650 [Candidatus Woesearchaeota archaeon]